MRKRTMGLVRYRSVDDAVVSFEAFYLASRDSCLRAVVAVGADRLLAEDLVAEAFARAWASWPKVSRHPAPQAWVVRTALNANISHWRRARRETPIAGYDRPAAEDAAFGIDRDLLALLHQLPRRQREVIALRIFLDLDVAQTAAELGIAPGTVTAHLARAVATIRSQFTPTPTTSHNLETR